MADPIRQCAGCGVRRPQTDLVRLAISSGELVIDGERLVGGRGAYVCPSRQCVQRASRKGTLPRRLRAAVTVPQDLAERIRVEAAQAAWKN